MILWEDMPRERNLAQPCREECIPYHRPSKDVQPPNSKKTNFGKFRQFPEPSESVPRMSQRRRPRSPRFKQAPLVVMLLSCSVLRVFTCFFGSSCGLSTTRLMISGTTSATKAHWQSSTLYLDIGSGGAVRLRRHLFRVWKG